MENAKDNWLDQNADTFLWQLLPLLLSPKSRLSHPNDDGAPATRLLLLLLLLLQLPLLRLLLLLLLEGNQLPPRRRRHRHLVAEVHYGTVLRLLLREKLSRGEEDEASEVELSLRRRLQAIDGLSRRWRRRGSREGEDGGRRRHRVIPHGGGGSGGGSGGGGGR